MKFHHSAGGVVLNEKGELVLITSEFGLTGLPKGRVNQGEDYLEAAKREVYEETGISDLKYIDSLGSYERPVLDENNNATDEIKIIHIFLFETTQKEFNPITKDEVAKIQWVEKNKAKNLFTNEKDKEFYLSVLDKMN